MHANLFSVSVNRIAALVLVVCTLSVQAEEATLSPLTLQKQEEAVAAYDKNDFDKAFELAEVAQSLYESQLDDPKEDSRYRKLIRLFAACKGKSGQFAEAADYSQQFIDATVAAEGDPVEIASADALVGMYLFKQGSHAKGLDKMAGALTLLTRYKADGNIEIMEVYSVQCDLLMSIGLMKNAEIPCQKSGRPFIGRPTDLTYVTYPLLFARYNALSGSAGTLLARVELAHIEDYVRQSQAYPSHKNYKAITWGIYTATADVHASRAKEELENGKIRLMVDYLLNARRCHVMAERVTAKDPAREGTRLSEAFASSNMVDAMIVALHDLRIVDEERATADLERAQSYLQRSLEIADDPRCLLNARLHQQLAQVALIRARLLKSSVDVDAVDKEYRAAFDLFALHLKEFAKYETTLSIIPELVENLERVLSDYLSFYFEHQAELKGSFPFGAWLAREGYVINDISRMRARPKELEIDLRTYDMPDPNVVHLKVPSLAALVVTEDGCEIVNLGPLSEMDLQKPTAAYLSLWKPITGMIGNRHLRRVSLSKPEFMRDFRWDDYDLPAVRVGGNSVLTKFADLDLEFTYPKSLADFIGRSQ